MVKVLLGEDNQWDQKMVEDNFVIADVVEIMKIPLPRTPTEDKICWHYDKRGLFSVRSAYHLGISENTKQKTSGSSTNEGFWGRLWGMDLPEKIRIFAWRAA